MKIKVIQLTHNNSTSRIADASSSSEQYTQYYENDERYDDRKRNCHDPLEATKNLS